MNHEPTLADLIDAARKGGEISYQRLSQQCGGTPSAKRLHQMQNTQLKSFPEPANLQALSRGTGFSVQEIVMACCRSLGLPVRSGEENMMRVQDLGFVSDDLQELIRALAREIAKLSKAAKLPAMASPDLRGEMFTEDVDVYRLAADVGEGENPGDDYTLSEP